MDLLFWMTNNMMKNIIHWLIQCTKFQGEGIANWRWLQYNFVVIIIGLWFIVYGFLLCLKFEQYAKKLPSKNASCI